MKFSISILIISLLFFSCDQPEKLQFDRIIINANIVDISNDSIQKNKFIGINQDTIHLVGDMTEFDTYTARDTINASEKFVMPGLWDMHVHFRGGDSLIDENKELLNLFLAYGITTVRDAGGDITMAVMDWKENIAAGSLSGPRIFSSGPKLDGSDPTWEGSLKVYDLPQIEVALDSLEEINVDYVKIYDGSLEEEVFYKILEKAKKRNLKTTSHVPLTASLLKSIDKGLNGVEHMYYIVKAASPFADSLSKTASGYGMMPALIKTYDEELAQEVYRKLAKEEVSVTPTLHVGNVLAGLAYDDHTNDTIRKYMGQGIQDTYKGRIEGAKRARNIGNTMREDLGKLSSKMIRPMYDAGVNLLAGSDAGAFNSFVYLGESLHAELEELNKSGLKPAEALKTSLINGPKFFGMENHYGSVEKGKVADLLILSANPLADIKNTRSIDLVIKNNESYVPGELLRSIEN